MDFNQFKEKIYQRFNVNLNGYKERQLKRRIESLMQFQGFNDFRSYYLELEKKPDCWVQFMDKVTINVSEFFRNPDIFHRLETEVIPVLVNRFGSLRIWSAACSNGAEPYSLAMIMAEQRGRHTIHATDMDEKILRTAQTAEYPQNIIKNVSEERKKRYFREINGKYCLDKSICNMVNFKQHDLLKDDYRQGYHLIVCRNVTIYFTREAQLELYTKFSKSLVQGGILFIGATENIINHQSLGYKKYSAWFYEKDSD